MSRDFERRLQRKLAGLDQRIEAEWVATPAAVLVPLYQDDDAWHLLYTRRTDDIDVHRGQVSFPGGRRERGETAVEAALRESEEEVGMAAGDVKILGQMNPLMTVTQFVVTPVVGTLPWPYELRLNRVEVARSFGVPLDWLMDSANLDVEYREPMIPGQKIPVYHFKPYDGEVIWGVTARITLSLLELLEG